MLRKVFKQTFEAFPIAFGYFLYFVFCVFQVILTNLSTSLAIAVFKSFKMQHKVFLKRFKVCHAHRNAHIVKVVSPEKSLPVSGYAA